VSGLPHAKTIADRTSTAALIVYCEEELERIAKALDAEQPGLDEYINAAPDAVTRLVMAMRYKSGYDWPRIAHLLGGENTPDSVRMIHNRFLDRDTRLKD
jgi:hypothetical protein